jgi:hypothetical protein
MMWQDVLLERAPDDSELRAALAEGFSIDESDVAVVHSIEDIPAGYPVVAEVRDTEGDFKSAMSIYATDALKDAKPVHVVQHLCAVLQTIALISDESLDPYTMLLVGRGAEIRRVALDAESLDLREEYRLASREHE